MTKNTRQHAPDERAVNVSDIALKAASPPLQSPTMHTSEINALFHDYITTLLSPPVQNTKNTIYVQETSSPHPLTLRKTVTQLSPHDPDCPTTTPYSAHKQGSAAPYIHTTHPHNTTPTSPEPHTKGGCYKARQHHSRETETHIK